MAPDTSNTASLFSQAEIDLARERLRTDVYVNDICAVIGNLYKNTLPMDVDVYWNGTVRIHSNPVISQIVEQLRESLKLYILDKYPAMAFLFNPSPIGSIQDDWVSPTEKLAGLGEFWVITDEDYGIKAMHWGENEWQINNVKVNVRFYRSLAAPPAGYHYRTS